MPKPRGSLKPFSMQVIKETSLAKKQRKVQLLDLGIKLIN